MIKAVLFDFGGVIASEGFREGIAAIAKKKNLDEQSFFRTAEDIIYKTGYVTGKAKEKVFWETLSRETGIKEDYRRLRIEILRRFVLRPEMLSLVEKLRDQGFVAAILSDQTNWLDEINRKKPFYNRFDYVINSYVLGKSKRDASVFRDVAKIIGIKPHLMLFVDDNVQNIRRAEETGLRTIQFTGIEDFKSRLEAAKIQI
ncbi:MAG: HAD family phosphatase [Nitrospira bacterium HGW-Nitrospira-1]|nr:MAG: HAD family phosphatase [Nitrospira bacterium HGW-Nitrospira-1]